jgi:hypothetical protein
MFAHRWSVRAFRIGMALSLALGTFACTAPPPPAALLASSDPATRVPPARYRSVVAGAREFRPVEPLPWGDTTRTPAPPPPNSREQDR